MVALFVLFLLPPTVQLEDVSQHSDFWQTQHPNSCKQHVHHLRVLVLLYSWVSSGLFQLWEFLILRILLLFRHLHEIPELVRCHHQLVLHLDSELLLDLQAYCSTIPVSRLLTLFLNILLGISHTVGFFRLHFSVQIEIGSIILEINWSEFVLSILQQ